MAQDFLTPPTSGLAEKGNLLIVVLDDIGIEALSSYGEGVSPAPTPNLDLMAKQGVLFRYAYANPFCSPTRATIQTGRHAFRTGIGNLVKSSGWALQFSELTLPEVLRMGQAGYQDAAFGKWHLGNTSVGGRRAPNRAGWSHFSGELANSQDYFTWAKVTNGKAKTVNGYLTTDQVDDARAWIQAQNETWLCYLAVTAAHAPLHRPPAQLHSFNLPNPEPVPGEDPLPYFHAMIEALDTELGRLFQVIDFSTTTVLLVSDNGSSDVAITPPFTMQQNKGTVYEGGTRVALIVKGAAVSQPGREVTAMVNTTDFMATIAELAGVDLKSLPMPKLDSISFVKYLANPWQKPLRKHAFSENFKPAGFGPYTVLKRAMRDERYKLITDMSAPDEFYDLLMDPYESTPLNLATLNGSELAAYGELQQRIFDLLNS